jgi:hypothetical protein
MRYCCVMATAYDAFPVVVTLAGGEAFGGFSLVTGLAPAGAGRNAVSRGSRITLARGRLDSAVLSAWLRAARRAAPGAPKRVTITLYDQLRQPTQAWTVRGALPVKYTGPALSARGGEVAMEELALSADSIETAG